MATKMSGCAEFWENWRQYLEAAHPPQKLEDQFHHAWRDGWLSARGNHNLRDVGQCRQADATKMNDRAMKAADQIMSAIATDAGNNRETITTIVFLAMIKAVVADRQEEAELRISMQAELVAAREEEK